MAAIGGLADLRPAVFDYLFLAAACRGGGEGLKPPSDARPTATRVPLNTASAGTSHSCASRLYGEGIGLAAIQQLLGHRWLSTTVRYVHVADGAIENAYQQAAERAAARFKE